MTPFKLYFFGNEVNIIYVGGVVVHEKDIYSNFEVGLEEPSIVD